MTVGDRERIDTGLLVVAFFLGILFSIGLKMDIGLGEGQQYPDWLPAVTSGFIIVAYAVLTLVSVRARLDSGQIGDNAYYLGFVLTLVALAVTLYEIGSKGTEISDDLLRDVIAGFGIALSSTIIGVCVRVVLLQYRVDLVAREREMQHTLNDAMRRFHSEIEEVVRGTKYLGIEIRQSLDEQHQHIAENGGKQIEKLMDDLASHHQKTCDAVVTQIKDVNEVLAASTRTTLETAETATLKVLRELPDHLRQTNLAVAQEARSTADALKRSLEQLNAVMAEGIGTLKTQIQHYVTETTTSHAENLKRETTLIDKSATVMEQALVSFTDKVAGNLKTIETTMAEFADMHKQACQSIEKVLQNVEHLSAQVEQKMEEPRRRRFPFFRGRR